MRLHRRRSGLDSREEMLPERHAAKRGEDAAGATRCGGGEAAQATEEGWSGLGGGSEPAPAGDAFVFTSCWRVE